SDFVSVGEQRVDDVAPEESRPADHERPDHRNPTTRGAIGAWKIALCRPLTCRATDLFHGSEQRRVRPPGFPRVGLFVNRGPLATAHLSSQERGLHEILKAAAQPLAEHSLATSDAGQNLTRPFSRVDASGTWA